MKLIERQINIPAVPSHHNLISHIQKRLELVLNDAVLPVRFVITRINGTEYNCELGTLEGVNAERIKNLNSIFRFVPRKIERTDTFNAVF